MNQLSQKVKPAVSIFLLMCVHFVYSYSGFSQELVVLPANKIMVEATSSEIGLMVLPAQNIHSESGLTIDLVSVLPIEIKFQQNETNLTTTSLSDNKTTSEVFPLKHTKNKKTVSIQTENQIVSVIVSNKNGSKIENICPVSVAKEQVDHSGIFAVVSDKIYLADGTKLKVSHDLNIKWSQVLNFECNLFSVSSDKNILTVKLVNGAEFVFNTDTDLTLLSFLPSTQTPKVPFEKINSTRTTITDLNYTIVKDLKQLNSICKKKQFFIHQDNVTLITENSSSFFISHKANLWSPVTGTVYDSVSLDLTNCLSFQTNPNLTQSNIQFFNTSGKIIYS